MINLQKKETTDIMEPNQDESWKEEFTLGSGNSFLWKIGEKRTLHVKRQFKTSSEVIRVLTYCELKAIDAYVRSKSEWTNLANNVEKLAAETEIDGLGKFMFEFLRDDDTGRRSTTDGQLSSHLGALFVRSSAWQSNEKRKGIQFKANSGPFWDCLKKHYSK